MIGACLLPLGANDQYRTDSKGVPYVRRCSDFANKHDLSGVRCLGTPFSTQQEIAGLKGVVAVMEAALAEKTSSSSS